MRYFFGHFPRWMGVVLISVIISVVVINTSIGSVFTPAALLLEKLILILLVLPFRFLDFLHLDKHVYEIVIGRLDLDIIFYISAFIIVLLVVYIFTYLLYPLIGRRVARPKKKRLIKQK